MEKSGAERKKILSQAEILFSLCTFLNKLLLTGRDMVALFIRRVAGLKSD